MKAGASSMWASCCGLLNEVMGAGAVRGQQSAFGGGTNPFRFAQNADFSPYPSSSSTIVCKACGLAFSVFRKKHVCCDCKKDFCSVCSTLQENLRRCSTCHLLQETAFQRPQLMKLKVKDLRQYLTLRNIPTDSCREKEDLVELVLCHHGSFPEHEIDVNMDSSARSQSSAFSFFSAISAPLSSLSSSQGELSDRSGSIGSASISQGTSENISVASDTETPENQANDLSRKRTRASLSDLSTLDEIEGLTIRQLKEILARNFVNYSGCCEKWELVEKVSRLYRENEENQKSWKRSLSQSDSFRQGCGKTSSPGAQPGWTRGSPWSGAYPEETRPGDYQDVSEPQSSYETSPGQKVVPRMSLGTPMAVQNLESRPDPERDRLQLAGHDDSLCRICMDAVIDCVLLECGHMVTCTKCGKRMSECPICRQYVVRAVHVFKS